MTQIQWARDGVVSAAMAAVAAREGMEAEVVRQRVAEGSVVIPGNVHHSTLQPCGIGKGLRTKVNSNFGTSADFGTVDTELEKLRISVEAGADTVMDLSTGKDIDAVRRAILRNSTLPVGTVPVYQAILGAIERRGSIVAMMVDDLFEVIEKQAEDGVDFMTVHCGVTRASIERLRNEGRVVDIVSRGGAFLSGWMLHNNQENPLHEQFDRLLEIARRHDVTLSLGDGLRPGGLADATDRAQLEELLTLGELVERARAAGVQVMVEGPGHVPLDQITANVQVQKRVCKGAPFYVLGPLVTDVAAGYDHITAAIGGAVAAAAGADYLCYVTPAEHVSLPTPEDVHDGVIAMRIAAHAADIVKGVPGAWEWDRQMSEARRNLDWKRQQELALDPARFRTGHGQIKTESKACSMCGRYCAMELVAGYFGRPVTYCD